MCTLNVDKGMPAGMPPQQGAMQAGMPPPQGAMQAGLAAATATALQWGIGLSWPPAIGSAGPAARDTCNHGGDSNSQRDLQGLVGCAETKSRDSVGNELTRSPSTIHFHLLNIQSLVMLDDVPCEEAGKAGQALQAAVDSCKIKSMRKCVNTKTGRVVDLIQELHLADEAYRRTIDAFDPQKDEVDDLDQHLDHREQRRMNLLKALLDTERWVRSFEDGTEECKKDLPTVHSQYSRKS